MGNLSNYLGSTTTIDDNGKIILSLEAEIKRDSEKNLLTMLKQLLLLFSPSTLFQKINELYCYKAILHV